MGIGDAVEHERTATVTRVVDIGLDLFTTRGYEGTSLRDVADAVGFSKAALYHHFPSKAALLDEMLSPLLAEIESLLTAPVRDPLAEDQAFLLGGLLDLVFRCRREAAVLLGDRAVRRLGPGQLWAQQQRALMRRICGPRARMVTQIRGRSALTLVAQPAIDLFAASELVLREPLLEIALETCGALEEATTRYDHAT